MKKLYFIILLSFISFSNQAQSGYQNAFGDTTTDFGKTIVQSSLGFYCIVGATQFHSIDSTEIAIYFVNELGDLILSSTVGLPGNDYPTSVIESPDGNFIITGYTYGSPLDSVNADIFAIKIDNVDGFEIWSHFYGDSLDDKAHAIINTPDGNYLIAGSTRSFGVFDQSALALKIDDNGDMIWCKITGIGVETEYTSAVISADTSYILCGTSVDGTGYDHYITKMWSDGTILWTNQVGSPGNETSYAMAATADSGFIIGGSYSDPIVGGEDQLITKLDSDGVFVWAKSYATVREERITGILQNSQGKYVAVGYSNTDTTGVTINHLTAIQTDASGSTLWSNAYGYISEPTDGQAIIHGIDSGYACLGTTFATGDPAGEVFLCKIDTAGISGCDEMIYPLSETNLTMGLINAGFETFITPDSILYSVNSNTFTDQYVQMCFWDGVEKTSAAESFNLYPNPVNDVLNIEGSFDGGQIIIYDQLGQVAVTQSFSGNRIQVRTSDLSTGIYFVRLITGTSGFTKKIVRL